jgi:hypothetical protein
MSIRVPNTWYPTNRTFRVDVLVEVNPKHPKRIGRVVVINDVGGTIETMSGGIELRVQIVLGPLLPIPWPRCSALRSRSISDRTLIGSGDLERVRQRPLYFVEAGLGVVRFLSGDGASDHPAGQHRSQDGDRDQRA